MKKNFQTTLDKLIYFLCSYPQHDDEVWKEISNTNGKYYISNYGKVLSLCGQPKLLKAYDRNNYEAVKINGKNLPIHRLVVQYFLNYNISTNKELLVHHKDRNKKNNIYTNLIAITYKEHSAIHFTEVKTND